MGKTHGVDKSKLIRKKASRTNRKLREQEIARAEELLERIERKQQSKTNDEATEET